MARKPPVPRPPGPKKPSRVSSVPRKTTSKSASVSAAKKRISENKTKPNRVDSKGQTGMGATRPSARRRSAKSGLTGFGMTKSAVKQIAKSARDEAEYSKSGKGTADWNRYTGRIEFPVIEEWDKGDPYGKKAMKAGRVASSRVYAKYGVTPKRKKKK